jgi:hypothetical protein
MAVHAGLRGGNIRVLSTLDIRVAILAVKPEFSNVELVAVLYGLFGCVPYVGILR